MIKLGISENVYIQINLQVIMSGKNNEKYFNLSHMGRRSLDLIENQITYIRNKIPISELEKCQREGENQDEIYRKNLTQSEYYDNVLWIFNQHIIRQFYGNILPDFEKRKLGRFYSIFNKIEKELKKEK